jgi:hypothetical protein
VKLRSNTTRPTGNEQAGFARPLMLELGREGDEIFRVRSFYKDSLKVSHHHPKTHPHMILLKKMAYRYNHSATQYL